MPALLALLLLPLGTPLAAADLLGFVLNWRTAPDRHDLQTARNTALTGAGLTAAGLLDLAARDPLILAAVLCTAVATVALLTLAPLRHLPPAH